MNLVENIDAYQSHCGYCSSGESAAMGMWAHKISCEAYQELLDRGWRRSGQWVYRPLPDKQAACRCHPYTIRLDTVNFVPSKDQRKVLRRFEAFLEGRRSKPGAAGAVPLAEAGVGAQPCSAQPADEPLDRTRSLGEAAFLLEARKRKSHLISPSPVPSPARAQLLAEEASDVPASSSPQRSRSMTSLECTFRSASAMSGAEWACPGAPATMSGQDVPACACTACGGSHTCGMCIEQASGCCTPAGSEESAHSAVAAALIDQPALKWPEQGECQDVHPNSDSAASQKQPDEEQPVMRRVQAAMQQAVQQLTLAGQLPSLPCPAIAVKAPTHKQQKLSAGSIIATSPAAHALAAAARRMRGSYGVSAEAVAKAIAGQIAAGPAELLGERGERLRAVAEAGHLNFVREEAAGAPLGVSHSQPTRGYAKAAGRQGRAGNSHASALPTMHPWSIPASYGGQDGGDEQTPGLTPGRADTGSPSSSLSGFVQGDCNADSMPPMKDNLAANRHHKQVDADMQSLHKQQPPGRPGQGSMSTGKQHPQADKQPGTSTTMMTKKLEIRTIPASDDLIPIEFPLYRKYQILHHGEDPAEVTESAFRRFLIDTPLVHSRSPGGVRFGSFHQQYWVDGQLVAVGVVDVLPRCLSSAYLIWDPDLSWLGLGKLSALKEIAFVQAARSTCPSLCWYHMGYYLETCPKMRYKAEFHPSELLCMRTYAWVPLRIAVAAIRDDGHCTIGQLPGAVQQASADEEFQRSTSAADILVYCQDEDGNRQLLRLGQLQDRVDGVAQEMLTALKDRLRAWQRLAGPSASTYVVIA